jgi:dihydrofolate reductase
MGTPMIMGRKTFESLPGRCHGPAPYRADPQNRDWSAEGAEVVHSVTRRSAAAGDRRLSSR